MEEPPSPSVTVADLIVVGVYLLATLIVGPLFKNKASSSTDSFFLSGRSLPWYLTGTSMVATTFSAGTPLLITGFVWDRLYLNWWWWSFLFSNMITVVYFSRLWRRSLVLTDIEFCELRYGGKAAAVLRASRAFYFGCVVNTFILAWLLFSAYNMTCVFMELDPTIKTHVAAWAIPIGLVLVMLIYSTMAGLFGVIATDMIQFAVAMGSCIVLAVIVVNEAGGMSSMLSTATEINPNATQLFPTAHSESVPWVMFVSLFLVQWWCSYYPGSELGGGAYVAQRMMASRTEKDAQIATLWFSFLHYAVRPWPWILTALGTIVIYSKKFPEYLDPSTPNVNQLRELTYIKAIKELMPSGVRGLMLSFLCAAFMSTVDTQLNLSSSYFVRDLYSRFVGKDKSQRHYVWVARSAMVVQLMVAVVLACTVVTSVGDANRILVGYMSGVGLLGAVRFYWYRVNAWSEISAMLGSVVINTTLRTFISPHLASITHSKNDAAAVEMIISAFSVSILWLIVTLLTPPEADHVLRNFYQQVAPPGLGWRKVALACGEKAEKISPTQHKAFIGGILFIYGSLFFLGGVFLSQWTVMGCSLVGVVIGAVLLKDFVLTNETHVRPKGDDAVVVGDGSVEMMALTIDDSITSEN